MITIFGSSTSYISMPEEEKSYVHLLQNNGFPVTAYCSNGYTIWHANYMLPKLLGMKQKSNTIILHVGASECMTMKVSNFLGLSTYWLNFGEVDHYFMTYIAPKIYQASCDLIEGKEVYPHLLTESEFFTIYLKVLKILEGFTVLAIGMSQPSDNQKAIRYAQALCFDEMIDSACRLSPWTKYVNIWNICSGQVVDSNHLTPEGHRRLYDEIVKRLP